MPPFLLESPGIFNGVHRSFLTRDLVDAPVLIFFQSRRISRIVTIRSCSTLLTFVSDQTKILLSLPILGL